MSPLLDVLQWIGGHLLTGITGVVVGLFLTTILPDQLRNRVIFWGNRIKKFWNNDKYHIKLAWKYGNEEGRPSEELMNQLQDGLRESPNSYNRFEFERDYSTESIHVEVSPSSSVGIESIGQGGFMQDTFDTIRVTYEAEPSYRQLTEGLLDLQDADKDVGDEIVSLGFRRQSSAVTCDVPAQPTLQKLLGKGKLDTLRGESENGAEVDFSSNRIQIESPESTAMSSMIQKAIIYYS